MTTKIGLRAATLLLLTASAAVAGGARFAASTKAPESGNAALRWYSYNEAQALAAKSKKPMLVDVYTDWCGWCKRMEATTYRDPRVVQELNRDFVLVRLNAESDREIHYRNESTTERELSRGVFGVSGYPTTIFLKPDGEIIAGQPGYLEAAVFHSILRYVGTGAYQKMKYAEWARQDKS